MATTIIVDRDEDGMPEIEIVEDYDGEFEEQFIQQMWEQEEVTQDIQLENQDGRIIYIDAYKIVTDKQLEMFKEAWAESDDWTIQQLKWMLKCVREAYPKG